MKTPELSPEEKDAQVAFGSYSDPNNHLAEELMAAGFTKEQIAARVDIKPISAEEADATRPSLDAWLAHLRALEKKYLTTRAALNSIAPSAVSGIVTYHQGHDFTEPTPPVNDLMALVDATQRG